MPTGLTTRTVISRVVASSQTKEIPTSRTITTEKTVLVTITPPTPETSTDREPTSTTGKTEVVADTGIAGILANQIIDKDLGSNQQGDQTYTTTNEDLRSPNTPHTTLVDQTTVVSITGTTRVPTKTTDSFGNEFTTLVDKTLVSAQTVTTQVASTLAGVVEHGRTWTTLVDEITTISAITTRVPVTTTDSLGKLITTSREVTLPAQTITTQVVSTASSDSQDDDDDNTINSDNFAIATGLGLETQRRLVGDDSTAAHLPTVMVLVSTQAYTTVVPTSVPTLVPGGGPAGGGGGAAEELEVLGLTTAQYFAGAFLPTLLAVVATGLLEVVGVNAKLMQPFQALASASRGGGALAESSVFLRFDEWLGALTIPQAVRLGQPLIVATQLVVLCSALLAPLAAEAVAIYTPSDCEAMCYGKIAVQGPAASALEGLMGAIAALLVVVVALTNSRRWRTGVNHNPWSIAGMASLCLNREVREIMNRIPRGEGSAVTDKDISKVLDGRRYMLDNFVDPTQHGVCYGLVVVDDDGRTNQNPLLTARNTEVHGQETEMENVAGRGVPSWLVPLSWWFRALLIFCCVSVMAIVAYYQDSTNNSGFERFMDSRGFGIRFFSTMLGVLLGGLMGALFDCRCQGCPSRNRLIPSSLAST